MTARGMRGRAMSSFLPPFSRSTMPMVIAAKVAYTALRDMGKPTMIMYTSTISGTSR